VGYEFRVLGCLEVVGDGVPVPVGAAKLRALLAALLFRHNENVSTDELARVLWPTGGPANPRRTVNIYVMRLRKALAAGLIRTTHDGYRMEVEPEALDLAVFCSLLDQVRVAPDAAEEHELLSRALRLWRGVPLSDVDVELDTTALSERHLAAVERRIELDLDSGRATAVTGELRTLTAAHPLRERLWALLVRGLHQAGRTGEAIEAYHQVRRLLADELGIDPGPELHRSYLGTLGSGGPAAPAATWHLLPPGLGDFSGRAAVLDQLTARLTAPGMPIITLVGPPGVGKTALAVHLAHRLGGAFPDGRLFVDLRGYATRPPVSAEQALSLFLRTLGVPAEQVPLDHEGQLAVFRSMLAGKRVLVVLDNAADADHVRALLPATPGCAVLVTSRDELRGLAVTHGARQVGLDVFTADEARTLLVEVLGAEAVDAEPGEAAELVELCASLPLALRIAAANIAGDRHGSIGAQVRQLRERRLAELAISDDIAVGGAFDLSYAALKPRARQVFGLCGLVPGPDVTPGMIAAMADVDVSEAAQALRTLAAGHLVQRHAPDRYQLHDLLRLYAAERAEAGDTPVHRLLTWYLGVVHTAADLLYPEMTRLPGPRGATRFADAPAALAWLDAEHANLVAAVRHAAEHGPLPFAWQLADALRGYFWIQTDGTGWRVAATFGLRAATAAGDAPARAAMCHSLGTLYAGLSEYPLAIEHYEEALRVAREHGVRPVEVASTNNLAIALQDQGRLDDAIRHYESALGSGERAAAATVRVNLGSAYWEMGRLAEAGAQFDAARNLLRHTASRQAEVEVLDGLARLLLDTGDHTGAAAHAQEALELALSTGQPRLVAEAHNTLGTAALRGGRTEIAITHHTNALRAARDVGFRRAEVSALVGLANARRAVGDLRQALALGEQALELVTAAGLALRRGRVLHALAQVHFELGDHERALDLVHQALRVHRETGHRLGEARSLRLFADLVARLHGTDAAAGHGAEADALFAATGATPV
jgi:DNA-binding SARP family transcriptional activator/tetratricopeptide (TPR) repeat protein